MSLREFLERLPVSLVRQLLGRLELLSPDRCLGRRDDQAFAVLRYTAATVLCRGMRNGKSRLIGGILASSAHF
jgi:hypothetical protein